MDMNVWVKTEWTEGIRDNSQGFYLHKYVNGGVIIERRLKNVMFLLVFVDQKFGFNCHGLKIFDQTFIWKFQVDSIQIWNSWQQSTEYRCQKQSTCRFKVMESCHHSHSFCFPGKYPSTMYFLLKPIQLQGSFQYSVLGSCTQLTKTCLSSLTRSY